jgi:hypothetical protein
MARTRTFSTTRPSASVSTPSIVSRPPFGVSRTVTITPSAAAVQASTCGQNTFGRM